MVGFTIAGTSVTAETRPDLFSPKDLDRGTQMLLEVVADFDYTSALDWGCGWGAMALWLAKHNPKADVVALDSDLSAVKATQANRGSNMLENLTVVASPGFEEIEAEQKFDLIVSNPPTHRGREVVETMIAQSAARLTKGGKLVIVVEARLKPWVDRVMKEHFGKVKVVKRSPKHAVLVAS